MKVKVKNLRNLYFEDYVDINKMNIVLGQNSSGKSSFLRLFPLLKQSIETNIVTPILWYGPYVDFGSFEEARCSYRENDPIEINFLTKVPVIILKNKTNFLGKNIKSYHSFVEKGNNCDFGFSVVIQNDKAKEYRIKFDDNEVCLKLEPNNSINIIYNNELLSKSSNFILTYGNNSNLFIPFYIEYVEKSVKKEHDILSKNVQSALASLGILKIGMEYGVFGRGSLFLIKKFMTNEIKNILKDLANSNTKDNTLTEVAEKFIKQGILGFKEYINCGIELSDIPKTIEKKLRNKNQYTMERDSIIKILLFGELNFLIELANQLYFNFIETVEYIEPLRASAKRYYRKQSLSIQKIDSRGANIHTFIDSLDTGELNNLNTWISSNFNFKVDGSLSSSHNSIYIIDSKTGVKSNMADCGFGFSQILPIILQLWLLMNEQSKNREMDRNNNFEKLIIIEQPEVHLHPAFQAALIDAMCSLINISKEKSINISFLIETHSETIVNRMYNQITSGKFDSTDLSLYIFDRNSNGDSLISKSSIEKDNTIINWPYGFFSPEVL